jgi:hypothetical protein
MQNCSLFQTREFWYGIIILFISLLMGCSVSGPEEIDWGTRDEESSAFQPLLTEQVNTGANHMRDERVDSCDHTIGDNDPPLEIDLPSLWVEFTDAPCQNQVDKRSSEAYLTTIRQFDLDDCRYTRGCKNPDTRCNIYASDVMNAMGAHLPTKGELGVGVTGEKYTDRMPAQARHIKSWLETGAEGWQEVDAQNPGDWNMLMQHLASGKPGIVISPDHIAVLRPDQGGVKEGHVSDLLIAQAGAYNSYLTSIGIGFGKSNPVIYIHE